MQTDPIIKSKRVGAIVAIIIPILARYTGIDIDTEMQSHILTAIDLVFAGVASGLLVWSKFNEKRTRKGLYSRGR